MKNKKLCRHRHSQAMHPNCFKDSVPIELTPPNILVLDVETLPILAYVWGAYEQNLNVDSVVKDWCLLSWSAKWLQSSKVISDVLTPEEAILRSDTRISQPLWKLVDKADIIIAHNGRQFDLKKINTRFLFNGLSPPSSYRNIDTLVAARSVFGITMNKQDYIAKFLGIQRKLHTEFQLWVDCDNGNKKALKQMLEYNEHDVEMLEEIYLKIRPWIINHPNLATMAQIDGCPVCMSNDYSEVGIYYTNQNRYTKYGCRNCGASFRSSKSIR